LRSESLRLVILARRNRRNALPGAFFWASAASLFANEATPLSTLKVRWVANGLAHDRRHWIVFELREHSLESIRIGSGAWIVLGLVQNGLQFGVPFGEQGCKFSVYDPFNGHELANLSSRLLERYTPRCWIGIV
jgi:uncharacterized DUF497 family protein